MFLSDWFMFAFIGIAIIWYQQKLVSAINKLSLKLDEIDKSMIEGSYMIGTFFEEDDFSEEVSETDTKQARDLIRLVTKNQSSDPPRPPPDFPPPNRYA